MIRNMLILLVFMVAGIFYLAYSGVKPEEANLPYQIGVAFVTSGAVLFLERFLSGDPNKDCKESIDDLRLEIEHLSRQITLLQEALEDET